MESTVVGGMLATPGDKGSVVRVLAAISTFAISLSLLASCSSGPNSTDAAEELAKALTAGDISHFPTTDRTPESQADLIRIVKGLGESSHKVSVKEVSTDDDTATVTLSTERNIDDAKWIYSTQATLIRSDDEWKVDWKPSIVADISDQERLIVRRHALERADILGAGDQPLVTNRPVIRFGIDKTRVKGEGIGSSASALATLLGINAEDFTTRVKAAGPQAFVEGLVLRANGDTPSDEAMASIPGALGIKSKMALAPTRTFGQPLLGIVGEATAEIIEDSEGQLKAGDQTGLSGLQKRYDAVLRGKPGIEVLAVDSEREKERRLFATDPQPGKPLSTTIDAELQKAAEKAILKAKSASALVAIQPSTGAILALANSPETSGNDIAAAGRFAPGSTFKIVSALGLIRSGMTERSKVPCTPTINVDGRTFKNYSDYPSSALGNISLRQAIAQSCNTAMIATRNKVSPRDLASTAQALGLGRDIDLGISAFLGSVPDESQGTDRAASMIGQGRVEASPLAMAVVAASVQKGSLVTPVLLPDVATEEASNPQAELTPKEAASLSDMMRAVVTDGSGRLLNDLPGGRVLAKTGTAEYGDKVPPKTHGWMIATQDDLAVAVFVQDGASGSASAGPLLKEFLRD